MYKILCLFLRFPYAQENEQSRLLNIKSVLPDGKYGNVFELNIMGGAEHWYCNVCRCPIMGRTYHHENGRRHKTQMSVMNGGSSNIESESKSSELQPAKQAMEIAPGEPVPPGFEQEMVKEAEIQPALNAYRVGPIVGVEYVVEMQEYDKEANYLCMLCDKHGDPRTVIAHLASYNHIRRVSFSLPYIAILHV